jgi:hypothetical protein
MPTSEISPVFLKSVEDLLERLEDTPDAHVLTGEARELVGLLRTWLAQKPTAETRRVTINRVLDLNLRAMEFLANRAPPSR